MRQNHGISEEEKFNVEIQTAEFEAEAKDYRREQILEFYKSADFQARFKLSRDNQMIETRDKF